MEPAINNEFYFWIVLLSVVAVLVIIGAIVDRIILNRKISSKAAKQKA